jgi:hypothetical protein
VHVLQDWAFQEIWVFAVYPNRKVLAPKLRSFIDFLIERFGPEPYWDAGAKRSPDAASADIFQSAS